LDLPVPAHSSMDATLEDPVPVLSADQTGVDRLIRGGSWDSDARIVRAAVRLVYHPDYRIDYVGFRLARSATPKP
jgi:formylglycine-generating enzyme required for sulfatase activity